jgi:hypothetical protein
MNFLAEKTPLTYSREYVIIEIEVIILSKPTSAVKRKYNKAAYDRHEISVGKDTELAHRLMAENNVSGLIKELLCKHYSITASQLHDYIGNKNEQ